MTSRRRSPRSNFETNDCGLPSVRAKSAWVKPAFVRASARSRRNCWCFRLNGDLGTSRVWNPETGYPKTGYSLDVIRNARRVAAASTVAKRRPGSVDSRAALVALLALAGTGCLPKPQTPTGPSAKIVAEERAQAATKAYVDCVYAHADTLARSSASATEAADAAVAECGREFTTLRAAIDDYYVSVVSRSGVVEARTHAQTMADSMRDDTRGAALSRVIRDRGIGATP